MQLERNHASPEIQSRTCSLGQQVQGECAVVRKGAHEFASHVISLLIFTKGFSGRTLRRLPVLAHTKIFSHASSLQPIDYWQWLAGLDDAINDTIRETQVTQKPAS